MPQGEGTCLTLPHTQYTCLIQSANDPQDPYPTPCYPGYKNGLRTSVQGRFSLELGCYSNSAPTLINFISLSFCLSGNSFPTCPQTTTIYIYIMPGWMKHKLESRFLGEIPITSDIRWHNLYSRKRIRTKEPPDESERGEWKSWLKAQHSEN